MHGQNIWDLMEGGRRVGWVVGLVVGQISGVEIESLGYECEGNGTFR